MLKVMRESFKHLKWVLILIVAAFVIMVFADWGAGGSAGTVTSQSFIARVNGEVIPISDFARTMYLTEQQYEQAYGSALTPEMREQLGLSQGVLNGLIEQKLLLQQAKRLNLVATDEEVRKRILALPVLNPEGQFVGQELYERYVTGNLGYPSAAAFEDEIKRELTLAKINSAMMNSLVIPESRVEEEYRRRNENVRIRYVLYPTDRALAGVTAGPAEVEAHYRENTFRYTHPAQRNVRYLLADLARIRSQMSISEEDLRAQYEASKEAYRQGDSVSAQHVLIRVEPSTTPEQDAAARQRAEEVLAKARAGEDFSQLAREFSEEPGAATTGGDLGFFTRGMMVPEFEEAAFALQPGQISEVVKTQFGYHVIRVNERRQNAIRPYEEVRSEIETSLADQRVRNAAREAIASARARLEATKPITLADLQSVTGQIVTFNDARWFGRTEPVQGLGRAPAINDWAFNQATVGETGPIMETPRGPVIPYLVGERPAGVLPLAEVRARVENEAKLAQARAIAQRELKGVFDSLGSIDAAASTLSLTPQEATVNRATSIQGLSGSSQALVEAAMASKTGETKGPVIVDDGAVVFTVLEETRFDKAVFDSQKTALLESIRQTEFRNLRASLIDDLRAKAEVAINSEALQQVAPSAAGM
ncbi:MAG TPA: peptidylprolyl isomerase [Thermoanaerobaculia bacterium]|nr:peptidylprolyl isomerase [Thermoanaerobaculia bacterium]